MATSSTPAAAILSRALFKPCTTHVHDRRLARVAAIAIHPPRSGTSRDQLAADRPADRRPLARVGGGGAGHRRAPAGDPEVRRAATVAAYVSVGAEPGTAPLLDALRAAGQAGDPAGAAARRRPGLGGVRRRPATSLPARRGLLEPVGPRLGPDAVAHRRRRAGARAGGRRRRGCGSGAAAAPTTGPSAGSRSAPSPACCSTTTRSASTSRSSRTTGRSPPRSPRPGVTSAFGSD